MPITHNIQYPPAIDTSTTYWTSTPTLSSNAAVPTGCPYTYAVQIGRFDFRIYDPLKWFPSRLPGAVTFEISGYAAVNDNTKTNTCDIFIRYGSSYSNTTPNGYDASQVVRLSPANYGTWTFFKFAVNGTIPSNGTGMVTINMNGNNDGTGTNWWVAGLQLRKLQ